MALSILKRLPTIMLFLALGYIMYLREFPGCQECPEQDTIIDYVYFTDTLIHRDTSYIPIHHYHTDTLTDTIEVFNDYFTKTYYSDTILNDTNGLITISDTISRNRIISRSPSISIFPHIITQTKTIKLKPEVRNKLYVGVGVGKSDEKFGITGNIGLATKRESLYTISYDVLNKDVYFTMYWKLSFKR